MNDTELLDEVWHNICRKGWSNEQIGEYIRQSIREAEEESEAEE